MKTHTRTPQDDEGRDRSNAAAREPQRFPAATGSKEEARKDCPAGVRKLAR